MRTVGTYAAKTKLPDLLHFVEAGERFTITRNGKPVAKLVPLDELATGKGATDVVQAFRNTREPAKEGGPSIRSLINQGRRL